MNRRQQIRSALLGHPAGLTPQQIMARCPACHTYNLASDLAILLREGKVARIGEPYAKNRRWKIAHWPAPQDRSNVKQVLGLIFIGKTSEEIAQLTGLTVGGVRHATATLIDRYGAANRTGLIYQALRAGDLQPPQRVAA